MRYTKLINGFPSYAPNPILVDGSYTGNPPGSVYEAEGYKPVVYSDPPGDAPAGYQWVESWSEGDGNIQQGWVLEEITELYGDQAMKFLFGVSLMWNKDLLLKMKRNIHLAAVSLPDEDAAETPELFPAWSVGQQYTAGQRVQYEGLLFRCEQSHTSQEDWTPYLTPSLWTLVAAPGTIPVWKRPTGAQDAYQIGDLVHYPDQEGPVYVCTIANNVWSPDVTGWDLYEAE